MNILHVLSQNQLTGAEVHAADLISEQTNDGHTVFQISNLFFKTTKAQQIPLAVETKNIIQFIKSTFILKKFLIKNNIQIIHSHSRAAAKLVFYARFGLKMGHVSTVHGRQHVSFSKKIFNQYGEFIIPVCKNIYSQLTQEFFYNPRRIMLLANPIDTKKFQPRKIKEKNINSVLNICIIGRTTGPKKIRTELFVQHFSKILKEKNIEFKLTLVGGRLQFKENINYIDDVIIDSSFLHQFDLICGSGRVAMESILAGVPTIAFGESSYIGLVTEDHLVQSAESCFGDIGQNFDAPVFNFEQALIDLNLFYSNKTDYFALAIAAQKIFDLKMISKKVMRLYESAYFLSNYSKWIPVLMYHKIPDKNLDSVHKIYVTKNTFEKHLKFFKQQKMTTITFDEISLYRQGLKDWIHFPKKPLILTFDDGYTDNITNADPLLKKYKMKAHVYLLADSQINKNQWDIPDVSADIVSGFDRKKWLMTQFEIGSHGLSHKKMPDMDLNEKLDELKISKEILRTEFNQKIISFAFTYGDTNQACAEAAEQAGYEYAVNTDTGGFLIEENPYSIFRVNIFPDENLFSIWKKTRTWYRKYYYIKRNK